MEDIAFLGCFFGLPVLMVLALLWVALRALRARSAWRRALRQGWKPMERAELDAVLRNFPPLNEGGKVVVDRIARKPIHGVEAVVCRYHWTSKGHGEHRHGRREAWLVLPAGAQLPRAVIQPRTGGLVERALIAVMETAGAQRIPLGEAWDWALVFGPGAPPWFSEARGSALKAVLKAPEQLWLHDRNLVLVLPDHAHGRLLRDAERIAEQLRRATDA
ncbi:MAG: hypothetical protein EP330_02000 [Deltaproteobacteria bacterium]|nr:MAG: hypothetical protein EP330_02000 [Deltaproteobacteria bacterium]